MKDEEQATGTTAHQPLGDGQGWWEAWEATGAWMGQKDGEGGLGNFGVALAKPRRSSSSICPAQAGDPLCLPAPRHLQEELACGSEPLSGSTHATIQSLPAWFITGSNEFEPLALSHD